ncbi:hypothetical protein COCCADRAFT_21909 [Bipolaris zeicola 26-R-13]|uniref:Uncharacterized protein n=1 Tax=Cochliobolus carbonum (strain 26-R-13) TaxID=930089 RepID=W6Z4F6_COCC2|nr:uncharacterized protein COCCADRAFT_21909 [Bipolaris zeicola 26-R-13]EUC38576.1 hypothetical protein COCCADRAFT_21909 [Bipolaris zeicola 26-R-13]
MVSCMPAAGMQKSLNTRIGYGLDRGLPSTRACHLSAFTTLSRVLATPHAIRAKSLAVTVFVHYGCPMHVVQGQSKALYPREISQLGTAMIAVQVLLLSKHPQTRSSRQWSG